MNEEHQEDESAEVESVPDRQEDGQDRDDTPQPESAMLTSRARQDDSESDATDELAQLFSKPRVWGTVLIAMIALAVVWAYIDSTSNDVTASDGWTAYHDEIVAELTNLRVDEASDVDEIIRTHQIAMEADGSLPWAKLFKANLLLNKALMPDTSAQPNPLNPNGNRPSLLSGILDLRRLNLEQAILAFEEVIAAAAPKNGSQTLFDKIAAFRAHYGIAYCAEALMIVGDPAEFEDHKSIAVKSWEATSESVASAGNVGILKLVEDHYSAVKAMSADSWDEGDALTEAKFLSWLSKN
ncbi:MAG: hypothetical protein NZ744_16510, partial [Pirellulaceae bacterium]|nr:hypothetical protein [Pirellulaceae bacterium]